MLFGGQKLYVEYCTRECLSSSDISRCVGQNDTKRCCTMQILNGVYFCKVCLSPPLSICLCEVCNLSFCEFALKRSGILCLDGGKFGI